MSDNSSSPMSSQSLSFSSQPSSLSSTATGKQPKLVFLLLAVHCDQLIMYNEEMDTEEAESRAKQSLTNLTIVSIDFSNLKTVRYNGLCLRNVWRPLSPTLFRRLKRTLVFRDKFCNQRNFSSLVPVVNSARFVFNENTRRMPERCQMLQSFYRYDCNVPENVDQPLTENPFRTGLNGSMDSGVRYAEHYKRIASFIEHELVRINENIESYPVIVYHKLPVAVANWLQNDFRTFCPQACFKFLGHTVSAKYVRTSPHCRYRTNHNVCVCEVCLADEYGAQLVNMLTG